MVQPRIGPTTLGETGEKPRGEVYLRAMERLVAISRQLSLARDLDTIMTIVRSAARELTRADGATFVLKDGNSCFYADEDAIAPLWKGRRFPMDTCISGWSMLNRQVAAIQDIYADARIPADAYRPTFVKSLAMVPIRRTDPIGAIGNYWAVKHQPSTEELQLLQALADMTSVALENVQLYGSLQARVEELRQHAQRQSLLAKTTELLSDLSEPERSLQQIGEIVVSDAADGFAVDLVQGGQIQTVAVAHVEPQKVELVRQLRTRCSVDLDDPHGPGKVIRTGEADFGEITDELLVAVAQGDDLVRLARELQLTSFVTVPLKVRHETIGALTLVTSAASGRVFGAGDLELAEELARRCASGVENARLYQQAQGAVHLRDQFLSVASHELRTPLAALQLQVQSLRGIVGRANLQDHRIPERIERATTSVKRLSSLVDGLLDVSRISLGRLTLNLEPFDLSEAVRDAVDGMNDEVRRAGCELLVEIGTPVAGCWDRLRIEQVVTNLLSNAIKYGAGKPIEVRVQSTGTNVRLFVRDRGPGLGSSDPSRIFERFERAVSTRHYGGLGLGLYITREIVEAHGGKVRAESKESGGSEFMVELPRKVVRPRLEEAG